MKVKSSKCTNCGMILDMASAMRKGEVLPSPGDFSVCINCGHIMVFNEKLRLKNPSAEQTVAIAGNADLLQIQRARRRIKKSPGSRR